MNQPRRLVLCLDGTWNSGFEETRRRDEHTVLKPTNPLKLSRAVKPQAGDGRMQITYYDIGVGALAEYPGLSNKLLRVGDRIMGGAWGAGFEGNVEDALHFLVMNHEDDDEVFVFGFSRGAAEARGVTQFLDWAGGLPPKCDAYYLPIFFRHFVMTQGATHQCQAKVDEINERHRVENKPPLKPFRPVRVKFLGVWDTVLALGSRFESVEADSTSTFARSFYAGRTPAAGVEHAYQALAVDERRFDFRPEIWTSCRPEQKMEQRWFAGVHSNVGGAYGNDGLANLALQWIVTAASDPKVGLDVDSDFLGHYRPWFGDTMYDSYTPFYRVLDLVRSRRGAGVRSLVNVPAGANATLDKSVIQRMLLPASKLGRRGDPPQRDYRPANVIEYLAAQPDPDGFVRTLGIDSPLPSDVRQSIAKLQSTRRVPAPARAEA